MKYLFVLLLLLGCTQKYQTYHVIEKNSFVKDKEHSPITPKMLKGRFERQESCEGQIFFNRNAKTITDNNLKALVQYSCPGSNYLLDAKVIETWWTTIIYSRSCIELQSYCPRK